MEDRVVRGVVRFLRRFRSVLEAIVRLERPEGFFLFIVVRGFRERRSFPVVRFFRFNRRKLETRRGFFRRSSASEFGRSSEARFERRPLRASRGVVRAAPRRIRSGFLRPRAAAGFVGAASRRLIRPFVCRHLRRRMDYGQGGL